MNGLPAVLTATECSGCLVPLLLGDACIYHFHSPDGALYHKYFCAACWDYYTTDERSYLAARHHRAIARSVGYPNTKGEDNESA